MSTIKIAKREKRAVKEFEFDVTPGLRAKIVLYEDGAELHVRDRKIAVRGDAEDVCTYYENMEVCVDLKRLRET